MVTVHEWSEVVRIGVGIGWFCLVPCLFRLARLSPAGTFPA